VLDYIEIAKTEGASWFSAALKHSPGMREKDGFVEPTVFTGVKPEMRIAQRIFGPVLSIITFDDEEEAIEIANNTQYGSPRACGPKHRDRLHDG